MSRIVIPEGVTEIENWCFEGCSSLVEVKLPSTLKAIKAGAFADCVNLTEIELPAQVTEVGEDAFKNCPLSERCREMTAKLAKDA